MACHNPIPAYLDQKGRVVFERKEKALGRRGLLTLRCGMCNGCKADLAREWAVRSYHESQAHTHNCFITLTYSPEKLPPHGTLDPRDLELFFKRLRKRVSPVRFRFFACGEYGEKRDRPHYHACLFGWEPEEKVPLGKSEKGHVQYGAAVLSLAWGKGRVTWTHFDPSCARYVAHYTADKLKKYAADAIDPETGLRPYERRDVNGEIHKLVPEFQRQSMRPGLGMKWLEENWREVFPADSVVMDGREYPPPKAYWKWLKENQPEVADQVAKKRIDAIKDQEYTTGKRQMQKNQARESRLRRLVRPYHEGKTI